MTATRSPQAVSAALKAAGHRKAGRYSPWGYVDREGNPAPGFIVVSRKQHERGKPSRVVGATVLTTLWDRRGRAQDSAEHNALLASLLAAGYAAEIDGSGIVVTWSPVSQDV